MIARLSLAVFYIITRKLLGAFYVDQKKKGLLPSTLPSEHEQWGLSETNEYGTAWVIFPISFIHIPVVLATHNGLDAVAAYISSDNRSPTQVAIILRKIKDNSAGNKWGLGWIAIGY